MRARRQWVALTDVTDEHEGIQGYVKLSIVVLGPDDEQYIHSGMLCCRAAASLLC